MSQREEERHLEQQLQQENQQLKQTMPDANRLKAGNQLEPVDQFLDGSQGLRESVILVDH